MAVYETGRTIEAAVYDEIDLLNAETSSATF